MPVFAPGHGSGDNSLNGTGRSLVVTTNYPYSVDMRTLKSTPPEPGIARVDIAQDGKSCHLVWSNTEVGAATNVVQKPSTSTGLIYAFTRQSDPKKHNLAVYYWTAFDFRTGKIVWQRLAGTGVLFDGYYSTIMLGPDGTAYVGQYGGIIVLRDTR